MIDKNKKNIADALIRELGDGRTAFAVEAISLVTGEVKFDIFADWKWSGRKTPQEVREWAFTRYPVNEWNVTFYGKRWAHQTQIMGMMEKLKKLEDDIADYTDNEIKLDLAYSRAYYMAGEIAGLYRRYADYKITEGNALRAVATRNINYSIIK